MKTATVSTTVVKSKSELISIKRKITEAGKLADSLALDVKKLKKLNAEIRKFAVEMATEPSMTILLASGSHAASLSAEKLEHKVGPTANLAFFGYLGLDKFIEVCTFPIEDMKEAVGEEVFDSVCPKEYSGKGRVFKITKKA